MITKRQKIHNRVRIVLMMTFDALAVSMAFFVSLVVRYYTGKEWNAGAIRLLDIYMRFAPIYAVLCVGVFFLFKFYRIKWEFAGIRDLNRILMACAITSVLYVFGTAVFYDWMTISYYCLGIAFQLAVIIVSRLFYKVYLIERNQLHGMRNGTIRTMVVGIKSIGQFAREQVDVSKSKKVVCVADAEGVGAEQYINGLPVISGVSRIEAALDKYKIKWVVLADEKLPAEVVEEIKVICAEKDIEVQDYIEYLQNNNDAEVQVALKTDGKNARVIPFSPPDISGKEIAEVGRALRSGWITTGPRTKELEKRLAEFCHTSRVVCLNSATASEELNFRICGIGPGDEVIVPAYTYTATASAAIHCGARVVFVDSQPDSTEMDYEAVGRAITERTKAVVAVDLGGIICDYDKLYAVIEEKRELFRAKEGDSLGPRIQQAIGRVLVFADCAHALGASRAGKMAGEIADFTDFSFHAVKNFTTAEGGASTWRDIPGIDNEEIYHQYQLYSLHGQSKDALAKTKVGTWEYDIVGPWYKCNMTDVMAAIGLRQLDRYPGILERRKEIIGKYDKVCDELGIKHLVHYTEENISSGHLYLTRIFKKDGTPIRDEERREIITKLAERGVATNVHYKPLPMMTAYKELGWDIKDFPNAHGYYENLITLPLHTKLSDEDVEYVVEKFREVVKEYIK